MLMRSGRRRTHQSGPLGELFDHGVDAVNTSLEVLIFAASQNLGMGWKTVMTLFGCISPSALLLGYLLTFPSPPHLLCSNLGRIPYQNPHPGLDFGTSGRNSYLSCRLCIHSNQGRCQLLAASDVSHSGHSEIRIHS